MSTVMRPPTPGTPRREHPPGLARVDDAWRYEVTDLDDFVGHVLDLLNYGHAEVLVPYDHEQRKPELRVTWRSVAAHFTDLGLRPAFAPYGVRLTSVRAWPLRGPSCDSHGLVLERPIAARVRALLWKGGLATGYECRPITVREAI